MPDNFEYQRMSVIYLCTELLTLFCATLSVIFNGFIIICFFKKRIAHADNLRLALFLAMGDWGYCLATIFHIGYLALNWSADESKLDYSPHYIIYSNSFLPANLKIIVVISLSMAFDRTLAIFLPAYYRQFSRTRYANGSFLIALCWFMFDYWFQMLTPDFIRHPGCGTMQCFVNPTFLAYVSISNTICGTSVVVMSVVIFAGVRKMSQKRSERTAGKTSNVFKRANRMTVGILFASLFFVTIPSLLVTFYEKLTGVSLFALLGPYYICCITMNGAADGIVFIALNMKSIKGGLGNASTTGPNNKITGVTGAPSMDMTNAGHRTSY